jgi:hypothetical protein
VGGVGCRLNPIMKWANELNKQFSKEEVQLPENA